MNPGAPTVGQDWAAAQSAQSASITPLMATTVAVVRIMRMSDHPELFAVDTVGGHVQPA